MAYENNHYIPQFILRQFRSRINIYNAKEKLLLKNQMPEQVFFEKKLYPEHLEIDINIKLEAPFAKLYHEKLKKGNCKEKITLTRKELNLMKRFFLLENLRVISMRQIAPKDQYVSKLMSIYFPSFNEFLIPDETIEERWHRNLQVVTECENLAKVSNHPLCTYEVMRWAIIFNSGFFAIWDCSNSVTDFLISDIGLTSEVEQSLLKYGFEHEKKDALYMMTIKEKNPYIADIYRELLTIQSFFHENFYMFPLSKSRMIVTVNPFFRLYDSKERLTAPDIWPSRIKEHRLFEKNVSPELIRTNGEPQYRDDDEFIYTIQEVNNEDAEYINMLMLDRVNQFMGYADWGRIKNSVRQYINFYDELGMTPPIDYSPLVTSNDQKRPYNARRK